MNIKRLAVILALFFNSFGLIYADCGRPCAPRPNCCVPQRVPACTESLCPYDTVCQCTDPGWRYNYCIDKCRYCEAFGNIGAR